jgi:hypothetical protein
MNWGSSQGKVHTEPFCKVDLVGTGLTMLRSDG